MFLLSCPAFRQVAVALELTLDRLESAAQPLAKQTQSDGQHGSGNPRPLELQSQMRPSPPVSDRGNTVNSGDTESTRRGVTRIYSTPTDDKIHGQTKHQRHTEWFMHPVEQLVQQYNCGDLTSVLPGVPVSPAASVTASKSVMDNKEQQRRQQQGWQQANDRPVVVDRSNLFSPSPRNSLTKNDRGRRNESGDGEYGSTDSNLLVELESYLNDELIYKRNARMAKKIISHLNLAEKHQETAFFALGAGASCIRDFWLYPCFQSQVLECSLTIKSARISPFILLQTA